VAPTVAAIVVQHSVLLGARATMGSSALSVEYDAWHKCCTLGAWETAALVVLMASCGWVMCAISRGQDHLARQGRTLHLNPKP
jgi:hypothetical protein